MTALRILVLLAGAATALSGCQAEAENPEAIRPVLSVVVTKTPAAATLFAGVITSRQERKLSFRVFGRVTSKMVDVGDNVERGEVLATLDSSTLELAVRSAQADQASATSQLANLIGTEQRQQTLLERKVISEAAFELAQQARQSGEAAVARTGAALVKAQEQLGYATLTANAPGVVTSMLVEVGQTVAIGETVAVISDLIQRDAVVDIPENLVGQVTIGRSFAVFQQSNAAVAVQGTLREIAPEADAVTRTRRLRIGLNEAAEKFRLGSTIAVDLSAEKQFDMLIPKSAILTVGEADAVWIVNNDSGQVERRPVEVSDRDDRTVMVRSGIAEGETVVTAGVHTLQDNQNVRVLEEPK